MNPESAAGAKLQDLYLTEAREWFARSPAVVVPVAAGAKQHGDHLPFDTDAVVMDALITAAVEQAPVLVAPPILHGWFPAFRALPGTGVADAGVFQNFVQQVCESLLDRGAGGVVLLNLGVARATGLPLGIVTRALAARAPALLVNWDDLETDSISALADVPEGGHGDEVETALMLHLAPERVRMGKVMPSGDGARPAIGFRPRDFAAEGSGVRGDARAATADKGKRMYEAMCANWLAALEAFGTEL